MLTSFRIRALEEKTISLEEKNISLEKKNFSFEEILAKLVKKVDALEIELRK